MNKSELLKLLFLAGKKVLSVYNSDFGEYEKEGGQPVTEADIASNEILISALEKTGISILSEESADSSERLGSDKLWIIDPLDGTSDFISKTGDFSIMVALVQRGQPVQASIYLPVSDTYYYAEKNKGAYKIINGISQKMTVSSITEHLEMRILLSRNHLGNAEKEVAERFNFKKRYIGSAGIKLAKIAEGSGEIYINSSDKSSEWDTASGKLILEEAGGKITDVLGGEIVYNQPNPTHLNGYIATNNSGHQKIVDAITGYEKN